MFNFRKADIILRDCKNVMIESVMDMADDEVVTIVFQFEKDGNSIRETHNVSNHTNPMSASQKNTLEHYILENSDIFDGAVFNKENARKHYDEEIILPKAVYNVLARAHHENVCEFIDFYVKNKFDGSYVGIYGFGDKSYETVLNLLANHITKTTGVKE